MIKSFEFYFDFASPYTFIAHKEIRKIEKENSIKMKYMPILLCGLLKSAGIKANVDISIKSKYIIKYCKIWYASWVDLYTFDFNLFYRSFRTCFVLDDKNFLCEKTGIS